MNPQFQLFPDAASSLSHKTDALFIFLCAVAAFFTLLIFLLVVYFGVRYRRRSAIPPEPIATNLKLEIAWTAIPLALAMVMFFWAAWVYAYAYRPPADALEIQVIGKQWMWKIQHANGKREINSLHLPLGRNIRLTIASQDVIHSFFIPAFRIKQDAVPGRYTSIWFRPTQIGTYHLFCAEYCGTQHSRMIGTVTVMDPSDYQAWLVSTPIEQTPAQAGEKLFSELGCITCHGQIAPTLAGVYGSPVRLSDGQTITADDDYIRESILDSTAKIVAGYAPVMPSFRGQVSEEQLMSLIAYIKSLKEPQQEQKKATP